MSCKREGCDPTQHERGRLHHDQGEFLLPLHWLKPYPTFKKSPPTNVGRGSNQLCPKLWFFSVLSCPINRNQRPLELIKFSHYSKLYASISSHHILNLKGGILVSLVRNKSSILTSIPPDLLTGGRQYQMSCHHSGEFNSRFFCVLAIM